MAAPGIVVAPGGYDCITARLVEVSGFDALYVTGSGVSMSALGAPDMGALQLRRDPRPRAAHLRIRWRSR